MTDYPSTALYSTTLIFILVLLTSGCIDNHEKQVETISIIQITGISGVTINGIITEVTFDLHVNGTTKIELGSLEIRIEVPPSFGQAGADIGFGYNGSDPWSGDGKSYAVLEPTRDTSNQLPLMVMGGRSLVLQLDLSAAGVKPQAATTLPFEITWGEGEISRFNLYMPTLIPTDCTFQIAYEEL